MNLLNHSLKVDRILLYAYSSVHVVFDRQIMLYS